jgi:hypothetical protein
VIVYIIFILCTQYRLQRERKEKKSGAAASHAKLAEKLLAAQMRREALSHGDSK